MTNKILPLLLAICFLLLPFAADAVFKIVPCNPLAADRPATACEFEDLGVMIVNIFNRLLELASLVAFLFIIWGGLQMVLGWFYEQPEGAWKDGVMTIRRAIFGFILVAAAFFMVNTVLTRILGVKDVNTYFNRLFP